MKRFVFWFLLALIAVLWLSSGARHRDGGPATVRVDPDGRRVVLTHADDRRDEEADVDGDDEEEYDLPRVRVEGLPVPVVAGSRVSEASAETPTPVAPLARRPARPPAPPSPPRPPAPPGLKGKDKNEDPNSLVVTSLLSATEERARKNVYARFEASLRDRLAPEVPPGWRLPAPLASSMVRQVEIRPVVRDYGTLYEATLTADTSPARRAEVVGAFRHEQVVKRMLTLGGLLAFVLACLGAVSGYIKADEATRGYYTNKLRLAAAAGVGAAGVVIYQMLT